MPSTRRPLLVTAVLCAGLLAMIAGVACTASSEQALVGTWTTNLVGYNQVAKSATKYDQTVIFTEGGRVELKTTLPGGTDGQGGTYEVVRSGDGPTIRIVWDDAPGTPLELGFRIEGDQLATTRRSGTMPKPPEINVQDVDPVVYVRR